MSTEDYFNYVEFQYGVEVRNKCEHLCKLNKGRQLDRSALLARAIGEVKGDGLSNSVELNYVMFNSGAVGLEEDND